MRALKPPPEPVKLPGLAGSRTGSQRVMHYAENTFAKRPYFAGNQFTAADIMMQFALKLGGADRCRRRVQRQIDAERREGLLRRLSEGEGIHAAHGGAAGISARDEDDDAERAAADVRRWCADIATRKRHGFPGAALVTTQSRAGLHAHVISPTSLDCQSVRDTLARSRLYGYPYDKNHHRTIGRFGTQSQSACRTARDHASSVDRAGVTEFAA